MDKFQRLAVIFGLSLLLLACSGGSPDSKAGAAAFQKMGVDDLDAFLIENTGKPTMLLFWTTWCPSCKKVIPEMVKLSQSHGEKANILSVSLDESAEALATYLEKKPLDMPVYLGDQALARKFNVEAIPTLALFDKNGKLVFARPGAFPYEMLQGMAEKLIGQ